MALAYLPLALVRINFQLMFASRTICRLIQQYPTINQYIRYFEANYIQGQFKPKFWNVFERDADFRTNNHVEGSIYVITVTNLIVCNIVLRTSNDTVKTANI